MERKGLDERRLPIRLCSNYLPSSHSGLFFLRSRLSYWQAGLFSAENVGALTRTCSRTAADWRLTHVRVSHGVGQLRLVGPGIAPLSNVRRATSVDAALFRPHAYLYYLNIIYLAIQSGTWCLPSAARG